MHKGVAEAKNFIRNAHALEGRWDSDIYQIYWAQQAGCGTEAKSCFWDGHWV
jgi:hypothetical protein